MPPTPTEQIVSRRETLRRLRRRIGNWVGRWAGIEPVCERCGCTDDEPCTVEADGLPCYPSWESMVCGRLVCSACAPPPAWEEPEVAVSLCRSRPCFPATQVALSDLATTAARVLSQHRGRRRRIGGDNLKRRKQ